MASKPVSGGGIRSSVVKNVGVRTGSRSADKLSPAGVSQLGYAPGDRPRPGGGHTGQSTALPVFVGAKPQAAMLGNAKALDIGREGPGTGRTVMRSGSQAQHGPVAGPGPVQGRDILGGFGPERRR
jgi:hypothetical protein